MNKQKLNRGGLMMDVMVAVFLVSVTGIIFASTFPTSFSCSKQAQEYKIATAIAQHKMEQLRATNYESITQPLLVSAGIIDTGSTASPYSFTQNDNVASQLRSGTGTISITDQSASLKKVQVTVSWQGNTSTNRQVQLTTLFADKRTRAVN